MRATTEDRTKQARFVFKGTIVKLGKAAMPEVPATERTAIVRVDEILQTPESLRDTAGKNITVELGGRKKAAAGEQFVFYANGWLFGEGVACQSIDHRPAAKVQLALAAAAGADPVEALAQRDARVRVESADLVVSGRVRSVSLPPEPTFPAKAAAAAAGGPTLGKPISEHDPFIQEAEIEVDAVHQGDHAGKTVKLLFPNSRDVKWYQAPKFRAGQEGLFILHRDEAKQAPKKAAASNLSAMAVAPEVADDVYTALHPADFQPAEQTGAVMGIIAAATGAALLDGIPAPAPTAPATLAEE